MTATDKLYALQQRVDLLIAQGADTGFHNLGALSNGWTTTVARYRAIGMGLVFLEFRGLNPGTTANGTVVWSAANGLPLGYQPATVRRQIFGNSGTMGTNPTELEFQTDGSITCQNIVAGITGMDANILLSVIQMMEPGASSVVTLTAQATQPRWLGTLGHVSNLVYSWANPGGSDQMTCVLQIPPTVRTDALNPGRIVQVWRGGARIWEGKLEEPVASSTGWTITAIGSGNQGTDFLAIYTAAWGTDKNDAVNQAITRGLRWTNPSPGITSSVWFGQQVDPGGQTITDLLNLFCTKGALTWYVNTDPSSAANILTVYSLPACTAGNVTRILISPTPVPRTLGGDINSLWLRYQTAKDAAAKAATYSLTNRTTPASITLHQAQEALEDLSSATSSNLAAVQAAGDAILARFQRTNFSAPFTIRYGELLTKGGYPVDPGTDQCGQMARTILTDYGYGGEIVPGPVIFMIGGYQWDDTAQVATATAFQSLDVSFSGLLSALATTFGFKATKGDKTVIRH